VRKSFCLHRFTRPTWISRRTMFAMQMRNEKRKSVKIYFHSTSGWQRKLFCALWLVLSDWSDVMKSQVANAKL
jgi:hypothetical protein